MQKDEKKAWESYKKLVSLAGTKRFTELVESAELDNPFCETALETVCKTAAKWLEDFDKSKLV